MLKRNVNSSFATFVESRVAFLTSAKLINSLADYLLHVRQIFLGLLLLLPIIFSAGQVGKKFFHLRPTASCKRSAGRLKRSFTSDGRPVADNNGTSAAGQPSCLLHLVTRCCSFTSASPAVSSFTGFGLISENEARNAIPF